MIADNGWRFNGKWLNGRVANGTMTYAKGDVENGDFFNGKTTLKQAINGMQSIRTYSSGKLVKSESSGTLQRHLTEGNYDKAYAVHGRKSIVGMEFKQNPATKLLEVVRVIPNAPADLTGIQAGDQILQYAGVTMTDKMQYLKAVQVSVYGTSVSMRIARAGEQHDLTLTPSIRPEGYRAGPGMVKLNSYQELFKVYLSQLSTFDQRIAELDLPAKYQSLAHEKKQRYVADLKAGQACNLMEEMWIYQGDACKRGLAHGMGSAMHLTSDLKFVGEFNKGVRINGLIIASGVEMYDDPVKDGRPDGSGIYFHEGEPEECRFYRGKRVDAVYKQRIAMAKQRLFLEEQQARQQAQIDSLRKDVNNNQFAIQHQAVPTSAAGLHGTGDVLLEAAKRKAAEKVMDTVFDKLF